MAGFILMCHRTNERNRPDIIVIGFQEIVPLTAQQIVQADPEKKLVVHFPYLDP
jgi:hypothetical protein